MAKRVSYGATMKFKTAQLAKHWVATKSDKTTPLTPEETKANTTLLENTLSKVLLSENLVVFTGLGTSLCLIDPSNSRPIAPTMADLWAKSQKQIANFATILAKVKHPQTKPGLYEEDIELLLSRCQMQNALSKDKEIEAFVTAVETLITEQCRFLDKLPKGQGLPVHESFLRKIARRSPRHPRARLFTTNYDLCFETAAARAGFVIIDGFSHTNPQDFDGNYFNYDIVKREGENETPKYISNVFQLLKLHGSVDWDRDSDGSVKRSNSPKRPVIIYPRNGKFESSYDHPYLEMMSRFQSSLRQPNTGLLIIGFGFRDSHLVQPILSATRSNVSLKIAAVGPNYDSSPPDTIRQLESLIDNGDRRVTLVSGTFEELTETIPDLVAETEEEVHRGRTKRLITS